MKKALILATFATSLLFSTIACAEDYVLTIKNNQFSPQELTIPAGKKVKVTVHNMDSTPAEFESNDLKREKVISGNSSASIFIGPVAAGSYAFFDEFHQDTAKGTIIAK